MNKWPGDKNFQFTEKLVGATNFRSKLTSIQSSFLFFELFSVSLRIDSLKIMCKLFDELLVRLQE